ncbi:coxsackievirus and adenovirus receptor homolog [Dicentrarchus labrax]|uniref:coxsackievirus and adenovirus receptor homolog n=1 Tax=Dicentrarchus labrax TaxID=13489 RepID=UPI0021F54BD7|nr:coxsackievirus and adenovirus receptor homolog [Dicentrarchus labrax]
MQHRQHNNLTQSRKRTPVLSLTADMFFVGFSCFLIFFLVSASEDQPEITVKAGDDAPLQCQGPREASIILLEWIRPDLDSHGYLFFYRNERSYESYQHPSYRGRVEPRDPELKNGDFSVVLKNVTVSDTGTYECRVVMETTERIRSEIRNLIQLSVTVTARNTWAGGNEDGGNEDGGNKDGGNKDGGNKDGYVVGVVVGFSVIGVLVLVAIVSFMILKRRKGLKDNTFYKPPADATDNHREV